MKIIRYILHKEFTFILIAVISGVYLYYLFEGVNPRDTLPALVKGNPFFRIIIFLVFAQLFLKGIYRLLQGKWRFIPSALLFISLSLMISGIYFSMRYREVERRRLSVSDKTEKGLRVLDINMDIPPDIVMFGDGADFKIKRVKAIIDDKGEKVILRPYPFVKTSSGYVYISDAGISPSLTLSLGGQRIFLSKLELLPPARKVSVALPEGYKMEISLSPEREYEKGRLHARQYNFRTPRYRVVMKQGNSVLSDTVLKEKEDFQGRFFGLELGTTDRWVEVIVVRDKTIVLLYAGLIGLLIGFFFYPLEAYYKNKAASRAF